MRSLRSVLFVPGSSEEKLRRALLEPVDAVIADFEDAVAPEEKAVARSVVASVFAAASPGPARLVRVNRAGRGLLEEDLAAIDVLDLDAVVVPKAEPDLLLPHLSCPVVAIVESAAGVAGARLVGAMPDIEVLMLGAIDLALELNLEPRHDEAELSYFRSSLVLDSALAGLMPPIDGVLVNVRDSDGLKESAKRARSFGMGGKACIHPDQVATVNDAFAPSPAELEHAQRVVAAYESAVLTGLGAVALDGQMIDLPVVERARRLLADQAPATEKEIREHG